MLSRGRFTRSSLLRDRAYISVSKEDVFSSKKSSWCERNFLPIPQLIVFYECLLPNMLWLLAGIRFEFARYSRVIEQAPERYPQSVHTSHDQTQIDSSRGQPRQCRRVIPAPAR